ncbi:MAG: hypothetical protein VB859_05655, partial [Planctomycetaceae bacterium]
SIRDAMTDGLQQLATASGRGTGEADTEDETADSIEKVAGQLTRQLEGVTTGLDEIRLAMATGIDRLASETDQPGDGVVDERISVHVAELKASLDAIRDALAEAAARPVTVTASPGPIAEEDTDENQQAGGIPVRVVEPDDPEDDDGEEELEQLDTANTITVVNKIPPSLLKVLRQQFLLMEGWMEPILKNSQSQQEELKLLRERLDATMDDYERLIGQVSESRAKSRRARRADK